tara:strand:- start:25 stop:2472 length:2448 start_codon:yes stop_codon:yes gene_type:complete
MKKMDQQQINFTPRVQKTIQFAKDAAVSLNKRVVNLNHLFIAFLKLETGVVHDIFTDCGVDTDLVRKFVSKECEIGKRKVNPNNISYTKSVKKSLVDAKKFACELGHPYIGCEHLFFAYLQLADCPVQNYFDKCGVDSIQILQSLDAHFDLDSQTPKKKQKEPKVDIGRITQSKIPALETFAVNCNKLASKGEFDPIVGRDLEVKKIAEILCRRNKNNPILLGEAGVGKSALVEALAQKIVEHEAPDFLLTKCIFSLDLGSMIAGTKYRGQFEERMKKVIEELEANPDIIIFIDEIHMLIGAGASEGSVDAANMLKPMLSRGKIKCIGATTSKEYKKYVEKDTGLTRRFEPFYIDEPSVDETIDILHGIIHKYQEFHTVCYEDSCIKLATELSNRYVNDRKLPDKAIDIIDQAGAKVKINSFIRPDQAKILEKTINNPDYSNKEKEKICQDYEKIMIDWAKEVAKNVPKVVDADIYQVVEEKTGMPVRKLSEREASKILCLKDRLADIVIGQDHICDSVAKTIQRAKSGVSDPQKPLGSFLFLGTTGVGKTLSARVLAQQVFGDDSLIQIDMSEFSEKISVSRLTGSSPGYVGHEEGGFLTEAIRNKPYSVVLFDEIEKAHPDVIQILLQILEEGKLTDGQGRTAHFRHAVIIMTGNVGSNLFENKSQIGFGESPKDIDFLAVAQKVKKQTKKFFKPELLNRIDEILIFKPLAKHHSVKIVGLEIKKVEKRLENKNLKITLSKSAIDFLVEKGTNAQYGARPLKRAIQKFIENPLSRKILEDNAFDGKTILFYKKGRALAIKSVTHSDAKVLTAA